MFDLDELRMMRRHILGMLRLVEAQIRAEEAKKAEQLEKRIFVNIGVSS